MGVNLRSVLGQLACATSWAACACHWATSTPRASDTACASRQGLVDITSIRWASSTAASRCTWAWCCRSSIRRTRSAICTFRLARGSLLRGAPALAASRCQAMASAILSLVRSSSAWALSAHSADMASCSLARLASSSRSRKSLAAPLSRLLSSRNTSARTSLPGLVSSHSRTRLARSPAVAAVKAPPVILSSCARSEVLFAGVDGTWSL